MVYVNNTGKYSSCKNKSVIFVGRFTRQKDIRSLLQIWSIVSKRFPDWCLQIYGGSGEEYDAIFNEVTYLHTNVFINDSTPNIMEKYCENSILLLTSLFEPFGLVLPEAMSCGLPVVAFDCPYGPRDIIHDGVDGFLINNRNIDLFAEKVCLLMDNYDLRIKMGKEGIKSSLRYDKNVIMPRWIQLFQTLKA
jgi:glycosyltransferase involved in cell wall biosynthesis